MISRLATVWLLSHVVPSTFAVIFSVPATPPANASKQLSTAPVGVSLEFFTFPEYITDVPATTICLENLKDLTGVWPPMRIGGTTQDRATYDESSPEAVTYTVADPADAPDTLTYGPSFIALAGEYAGSVVLGLNRRLNNIANTISAADLAVQQMPNLKAIELGNEPNFFTDSDPIADGASWTAAADYASQVSWQDAVCGNLSVTELISAGVYFGTSPMSIQGLGAVEGDANQYVAEYCSHNYPQSSGTANLVALMGHSDIASQIAEFAAEISAAEALGKPHVFGETNSATQGGGGISPTFGAALWIVDYVMQTVLMGTEALYFHQGTIGNCQYCWWGRYTTGAPYYGAYFATLALANADQIAPLDDQTTSIAAYAIYQDGAPVRVLLYNSEYYTSGTRPSETYVLTGLSSASVTAKRLTAPYSTSRVDRGESPTIAGQTFGNGDCAIEGTAAIETVDMAGGEATFSVGASEALLTINALQANWIWTPNWTDSSPHNTAGRVVRFTCEFPLSSAPTTALLHFSADTRYKLFVNGVRVAVGPTRSSPWIWYYDTVDIAPYLQTGTNIVQFDVIRYFAASRGAMPFQRTAIPGLTVVGRVEAAGDEVVLDSAGGQWQALVDESVEFPMGLVDDVFLHISERISPTTPVQAVAPVAYGLKTLNGELAPWRLRPRPIPIYEESQVAVDTVRSCQSVLSTADWTSWLARETPITLPQNSSHTLEIQAEVHSTAFLRWVFQANKPSSIRMKVTYSEGYELEPRAYPFFRTKKDRLDATGHLIGPFDEVEFGLENSDPVTYEPFWFRTFRVLRLEVTVGPEPVNLIRFSATQVNYPLAVKASWSNPSDTDSKDIWDVSIRTLRNCMFDGYSDCPFYEQLQYSGDSRQVGLFHYLLSGDDRLMRQAVTNYAASIVAEGLTQSRFPSHVPQVIAGFSLYWILQVADHHLFFGDTPFTRSFLPRIDGVLEFFAAHIDDLGLVSGLPEDVWQYVDWVTTWGATDTHPDKGVPTSGRESNRHTYFSLLYAYVLQQAARLVRDVGRPGYADEYEARAASLRSAVRKHCYDGQFFTDSTANVAGEDAYSQHCQLFAVLSGTAALEDHARLLTACVNDPRFSKCSYMMRFYLLRAAAIAGDSVYERFWAEAWTPWRKMLAQNLTTWEEDDVRQRSDCHAWGSVPIYEYCTELAGVQPISAGSKKVLFQPRLGLSEGLTAKVALGGDNVATVVWQRHLTGQKHVDLLLEKAVEVVSRLPGGEEVDHGVVTCISLQY
ncbi:Six-hairpin glycosidase-like protein [Aspergillus granulosus]|uniref:Six-hairpin glycosidase-like protein n=1 Tax=Aspergillus granulosus TaxID=176169 RepID=A0ABR4HF98_9EURO